MFVTHERFLNCSTQSSAENAAPAKGVGCCCVVDPEREESWLEGSAGWPVQEDPVRADGRPRLPESVVARALSDSFGLGAKKLDHPSWKTLSQAWGENSCLRFPWLLLLVDWVLDIRKDYGQSLKSKQWQSPSTRREDFSIRVKLALEIPRCKGASKWVPGGSSTVRVVSFGIFPVSREINVFVRARCPIVKAIRPGIIVGRSRASSRLRRKGMLTSSGTPAILVGRSLMTPYPTLRDCLGLGGRRFTRPQVVLIIIIFFFTRTRRRCKGPIPVRLQIRAGTAMPACICMCRTRRVRSRSTSTLRITHFRRAPKP